MIGYCLFCGETAELVDCYGTDFTVMCEDCSNVFLVSAECNDLPPSKLHAEDRGHLPNLECYLSGLAVRTSYFCPLCRSNLYEDCGDLFCHNCNMRVYISNIVDEGDDSDW